MASINIPVFSGEIPRTAPHDLDEKHAQQAQNVKIQSGALKAYKQPLAVFSPVKAAVTSMFRMLQAGTEFWLLWSEDVNAVPGPIANDATNRVYYTGQATPRKTNYVLATNSGATTECPNDYLELGVPAPTAAPTFTISGGVGANVTRSYVYTFITSWGEESKPSPVATNTGKVDATWGLGSLQTTIAGKYSISKQRIYRTLTDSFGNVNYQLVVEQNVATTYSDTVADSALGAIMTSASYDVPPSDLTGLVTLPNGVMAGFSPSGKQICFCEPYQPHAWPTAYRYAVEFTPVGIAALGSSLLIATQGNPYIMSGAHPSTISSTKLPMTEIGASKRSVVDVGFGAMYASVNGYVLSSPGGTDRVSDEYFSRDEWSALNPSSMIFIKYDQKIFMFYKLVSGAYGGYILDKTTGSLASHSLVCDGVYVDRINGNFYLLQNNKVMQWDADSNNILAFTWKSKRFIFKRPVNLGAGQVDADFADLANSTSANAALNTLKTANQAIAAANVNSLGGCWNNYMFNDTGPNKAGYTWNGSKMYDLFTTITQKFVTFKLWANGVLKFTKNITSREWFRMPAGYRTDAIEVGVEASVAVNYVKAAETPKELQQL